MTFSTIGKGVVRLVHADGQRRLADGGRQRNAVLAVRERGGEQPDVVRLDQRDLARRYGRAKFWMM
ncbi:MAG: hypothetical protein FJ027_24640 [Candidatus Rokubacteria bacterium]|nr:hypothetical protein [Candidatus Rokubacteria bacterium]